MTPEVPIVTIRRGGSGSLRGRRTVVAAMLARRATNSLSYTGRDDSTHFRQDAPRRWCSTGARVAGSAQRSGNMTHTRGVIATPCR